MVTRPRGVDVMVALTAAVYRRSMAIQAGRQGVSMVALARFRRIAVTRIARVPDPAELDAAAEAIIARHPLAGHAGTAHVSPGDRCR